MEKNYDTKSIENVFTVLNRFIYNTQNQDLLINLDITTTEGICRRVKLSNNKDNIIRVNKNIIVYNNTAIALKDIIKLKISIENIDNENLKNTLYKKLKNSILYRYKNTQIKNPGLNRVYNYKSDEDNIENYIQRNHNKIKKVSYDGISSKNKIENTIVEEVLSTDSTIDVHKENIIKDIDISLRKCNVLNSIDQSNINVVTDINIDKIEVLTNNAKEVEVAKPIKTNNIEVVRDIDISQCNIMINPKKVSAVKDIKENTSKAITNLDIEHIEGSLVNINENQIRNSKKINILELEPVNNFIDKNELDGKDIIVDPTGERYIGVVLDDGTFEPLKLKLKTYNILQDDTLNYISNIDLDNQVKALVSNVKEYSKDFVEKVEIEYKDDLVEYNNHTSNINDMIKVSKQVINDVVNADDTAYVVTKDKTQTINNVNNISSTTISKIDNLNTSSVIENIDVDIDKKDTISDINFNKFIKKLNLSVDNNKSINDTLKDYINGSILFAYGGIMIVEDDNDEITIYSTSKLNSVN